MKQGWEYKKLGEVCETSSGGTPSKSKKDYYEGGNIPWLRSGEVAQGLIYQSELFITEKGLNNSSAKLFPIDTIVLAMYGATVGQVGLLKREMATNQAICGIFPNKSFIPMFLLYSLRAKKPFFMKDAVGGAQPNISQSLIKNTPIPIPPLSEQQQIVEELDLLSSIIEKKKEQLKELDNLAQSIFYDMFGDPITNEKGWEIKTLGEICNKVENIKWQMVGLEESYCYIDLSAVNRNSRYIEASLPINKKNAPSRAKQIIHTNDILFGTTRPTLRRVCLVNSRFDNCICSTGFCVLRPKVSYVNPHWLFYTLLSNAFYSYIEPLQSGASYPAVSDSIVKNYITYIPPLPLQQQFASKMEAIEQQKELIKDSIKETETLFNSRMDYYFN